MKKTSKNKIFLKYFFVALVFVSFIIIYNTFDISLFGKLIESNIQNTSLLVGSLIFLLRSISIVIPVIPGTYCAVIAGYIYGVQVGLLIMFLADFISCSSSFFIARRFGRGFVKKLLGSKQMLRIEKISQKYLERNFFLMTGFLMTSWFDFVCYAVGFTKISWKKFMPALIVSIVISDIPFVAGGYTLSNLKGITLSQVLNGEVDVIKGPYLFILIISALIIFGLGLLNIFFRSKENELK